MAPPFSMSRLWHHVSIPAEVDGFLIPSPTWLPRFVHVILYSLSHSSHAVLLTLSSFSLSLSLSLSLLSISRVSTLSLSLFSISQSPDSLYLSRSSLYSRIHSTPRRKKLAALPYAKAAVGGQTECAVCLLFTYEPILFSILIPRLNERNV